MNNGVLYIVWGEYNKEELNRSIASVEKLGLKYVVRCLDRKTGLYNKASMYELSPFENTLYLDTDTIVLDDVSYGFDISMKHDIALCICEASDARRFEGIKDYTIEYNTGVIFFKKGNIKSLFDKWLENTTKIDDRCFFYIDGKKVVCPQNDQASFSIAIKETNINPAVLPNTWNLRPIWQKQWFGKLKIWHDHADIPDDLMKANQGFLPFQNVTINED